MSENSETVVLVADDEPSTLALVAEHVRSKGWTVIEASDGDMAWQLAHQHLPDLVILDVMMPGMSGWEVCRKIRESLPLAHTGVIMLTGIGQNLNEMTSPLYGADTHVDKPFEFVDLDEKIELTLQERRGGAFGRADHADEEGRRKSVPPVSEDEAPLTAPTGGARLTKLKTTPKAPPVAKAAPKPTAKKTASKKTASKKTASKKTSSKKTSSKKTASKKTASKKTASKKTASKKTAKKAGKQASRPSLPKKAAKKASAKKATKKAAKKKAATVASAKKKKVAKKASKVAKKRAKRK